ncbi:MAG: T9SS type A sorting domain-containing protein [Ignavibacteriae bacterium]|nr:T9SS type A sorting domain-containing protein [Ignavibacteriota bacterium]
MKKLIFFFLISSLFNHFLFSQTWVQKLAGIGMWSLAKSPQGKIFAGASGTIKGIFRSTNGGETWDTALIASVNVLYLACDSLNGVYATYGSGGLMKSTDGGNNWTNIPGSVFGNKTVQSVACGKNGYVYVGAVTGGIFRSTDGGLTFPDTALTGLTIVSLTVDRFNSNYVYAGASSASAPNLGFYRSTNAGLTFSANLNPLNIWAILQKNNHNLYTVTTSSGYPFSKSTDLGLNWSTVSSLSGAMRGACLDMAENIYTSGNGGVFRSTNDGLSFYNAGLTVSSNHSISYQNRILTAAAGTSNGGVWIYVDSTLSGISTPNSVPVKTELMQNYPNPFNSATKIKYKINLNCLVSIKVYDISGKEISTLVNGIKKAGVHEVIFEGSALSSGIYLYRIVTSVNSETRKMMHIK